MKAVLILVLMLAIALMPAVAMAAPNPNANASALGLEASALLPGVPVILSDACGHGIYVATNPLEPPPPLQVQVPGCGGYPLPQVSQVGVMLKPQILVDH